MVPLAWSKGSSSAKGILLYPMLFSTTPQGTSSDWPVASTAGFCQSSPLMRLMPNNTPLTAALCSSANSSSGVLLNISSHSLEQEASCWNPGSNKSSVILFLGLVNSKMLLRRILFANLLKGRSADALSYLEETTWSALCLRCGCDLCNQAGGSSPLVLLSWKQPTAGYE